MDYVITQDGQVVDEQLAETLEMEIDFDLLPHSQLVVIACATDDQKEAS